jgi:serine/threonine-protein kinase
MNTDTPGEKAADAGQEAEDRARMSETRAPADSTALDTVVPTPRATTLETTRAEASHSAVADTVAGSGANPAADAGDIKMSSQLADPTKVEGPGAGPGSQPAAKTKKIEKLGDYKLIKRLGAGGMGEVYKGFQESLERDVAIKVLFKHLAANKDFVERFQREARIMAKLDHPNIMRCYGVGEESGFHYFAMEFVDGGSMQDVLDKHGRLKVGDAVHVMLACARALQHAHELNMIHRDIKPDNILVTRKGVIKVADMGLAKAHGENLNLTRTGTGAGTPVYMSPEQARDAKHVDHRSDIYSLGCMFYAFLAGKPPFSGDTYVELFEAKEKGKFEPARKSNIEIPERLDLMIDKMVAKKPEHRYQTCTELIRDLEGLGLANTTLSFIDDKPTAVTSPAKPGPSQLATRPQAANTPATKGPKTTAGAAPKQGGAKTEVSRDTWYLSYHTRDGKLLRRKLTTDQIRDLMRDPDFDLRAQASHDPKEGYRALATYPEFEHVLRGRLERARADRKTAKFKDMYKQLEKEEIQRKRWRWFRDLYRGAASWTMFLIYLGVLAVVAVGGYFLVRILIDFIAAKMNA